ncbi:hypothetical protein EDB19DRAFT_1978509 [Suillus lakei]|nr:hypothetical protein EDB19DRAFT_1978509 [Suillus lakei]
MTAPPKPTEENWDPSSLLAYDSLPNHQDFESTISDAKFTANTTTDFYDRSLTSCTYALVGVACSSIFSCSCIIVGIVTLANQGVLGVTVANMLPVDYPETQLLMQSKIVTLTLNLIVTLCTESIGFVHGISLRSALASESRLRFNTNLRLLTAARGWYSPNGALLNGISGVLLIISYASTSLVICINQQTTTPFLQGLAIAGLPVLLLGIALLLQVVIALSAMRAVKILTWSSSPFDLTAALVHHTQLTPVTFQCMRCVSDLDTDEVVISLWGIVVACAGWAALVMYIWHKYFNWTGSVSPSALTIQTWSFLPPSLNGLQPNVIQYAIPSVGIEWWILILVNMAVVQGPLTLGLHCSELIANVIRDERQWRCATGRKGLRTATNPLIPIFTHPICLVLFVAKPFLHWMFGLSFTAVAFAFDGQLGALFIVMYTAQIWNLCIALFIFACFFTFVALRRPRGPQPAAYGHVQTLANLMDEWSPVMWWGHKEDQIPYCHAGTSDHLLLDVKMDYVYAGSSVGSLVPVS